MWHWLVGRLATAYFSVNGSSPSHETSPRVSSSKVRLPVSASKPEVKSSETETLTTAIRQKFSATAAASASHRCGFLISTAHELRRISFPKFLIPVEKKVLVLSPSNENSIPGNGVPSKAKSLRGYIRHFSRL